MFEFEYLMDYARQYGETAALKSAADTIKTLRNELNKIIAVIPTREDITIADDVLEYVQELKAQVTAMQKVIRAKCEACVARQEKVIEQCPFGNCALWAFRLSEAEGRNLLTQMLEGTRKLETIATAIREFLSGLKWERWYFVVTEEQLDKLLNSLEAVKLKFRDTGREDEKNA